MTAQSPPDPPAEPAAGFLALPQCGPGSRFIGAARREMDAAIVGYYVKDKLTIAAIADKVGCSNGYIRNVLEENNVKMRKRGPDPSANSERLAFVADVRARHRKGVSIRQIAKDVGRSYTTVF